MLKDCKKIGASKNKDDEYISKNKSRNRREARHVSVYRPADFTDQAWNKLLKVIIKVERSFKKFDAKTKEFIVSGETAYYVATKVFDAKTFSQIIRGHWGIENKNHYVRDVSMDEDNQDQKKSSKYGSVAQFFIKSNENQQIGKHRKRFVQKCDES